MSQTFSETDPETPDGDSADRPRAPEIKPPGPFRRMGYNLFNRETSSGRFFRELGRILLAMILFAGLGALAVYLLLYRPVEQQLSDTDLQLTQVTQQLQTAKTDRELAVQKQQSAEQRAEEAENRLGTELTRIQLLRSIASLKNVQLAIQEKNKPAAVNSITSAEGTFKQALARLKDTNPDESAILQDRFSLVRRQLDSDPERAIPDIDLLITDLARLDNTLK